MRGSLVHAAVVLLITSCGGSVADNASTVTAAVDSAPLVRITPRGAAADVSTQALIVGTTNGGLTTTKAGGTAMFQMVLDAMPSANVVVTIVSSNTAAGIVTTPAGPSNALTFTTLNWSMPQNVVLTGVSDFIADGTQLYTVGYTAASSDSNYNGLSATMFNVSNRDDNTAQIYVYCTGLTTSTLGGTATFTVNLTSQPLANVIVPVTSSDIYSAVVTPATLTFTMANWNTPQTVTLTGQASYVEGPVNGSTAYYAQVGPASSSDASYSALPPQLLNASQRDGSSNQLIIVAGQLGGPGAYDATGTSARMNFLYQMAVDASGNVVFADQNNHTIRKMSQAGAVTTIAGAAAFAGSANGVGAAARFNSPRGVAVDATGNIFVADAYNLLIRKIDLANNVTTFAGSGGFGASDGTGTAASFAKPFGLAFDTTGNLYVSDNTGFTIRKITAAGVVSTFAGSGTMGTTDGAAGSAQFNLPTGLAIDSAGNVFVADTFNRTIRKITQGGVVSTFAGQATIGVADGMGTNAQFNDPGGLAIDAANNLYVADTDNSSVRKITPGGLVTTIAGTPNLGGTTDGVATVAQFGQPGGIAVDSTGNIFVADSGNDTMRKLAGGVVTTIAGKTFSKGSANGTNTAAQFSGAAGVAVDATGNVYVADTGNSAIRKITPTGIVSLLAGGSVGNANGMGAAAQFTFPQGLTVDTTGNVFVADPTNDEIRKITPAGVVSLYAGGSGGTADGAGPIAQFTQPIGIVVDPADNLYVADYNGITIRKIDSSAFVTTIAGLPYTYGTADGVGTAARFLNPRGVALDTTGNVYVTDTYNHTIRKIAAGNVVTTFAGAAGVVGSADGMSNAARFNTPYNLTLDANNNVYVADSGNGTIRKITPAGLVTTILGTAGQLVVQPGYLPAHLNFPTGVAIFGQSLIIADANENVILRASKTGGW